MDLDPLQQRRVRTGDVQHGPAVFAGEGTFYLAAVVMRKILRPVADAQQRELALDLRQVHLRGIRIPDRAGTAGQDDSLHGIVQDRHLVVRIDFTINIQLPEAAADKLRDLGAEVEDEDLIHHGSS